MIFQEPMSSLNPVFTCGHQVMEAIFSHKKISKEEARQQTIEWLSRVRLPQPKRYFLSLSSSIKRWTKTKSNDRDGHVLSSCFAYLR